MAAKYEKVIYKSINTSEYALIYQILKNNIEDFPENKSINYKDYGSNYSFQIVLKSNHFRL
ncbi:hypothetical protein [Myroides sp. TSA_177.3]|uniref:hypothetical protein n=1 Tax=Myroides sp. TSA_177.3 TaxID=3415650 RepID=UPI0040452E11